MWNNKNLFFSQIENYPAEIVDAKGVAMRLVTAGNFIMGANIYQNDGAQISSENTIYLDFITLINMKLQILYIKNA